MNTMVAIFVRFNSFMHGYLHVAIGTWRGWQGADIDC